jgi:hypothetical protein
MPLVLCKFCKKEFHAKPSWLKYGNGKYCSAICHHESNKTGKEVACFACGKEVYKSEKALKGSKSKKYFCTKSCQTKWRNSVFSGPMHPNWKNGDFTYKNILIKTGRRAECTICAVDDKRLLVVHHVDENHFNNDSKNLAWLCYNCHHLVHHDKVEKQKFLTKHG